MKTLIVLLLLASFTITNGYGQASKEDIIGHWSYCDKDLGYSEFVFSDSLFYTNHYQLGSFGPFSYTLDEEGRIGHKYPNEPDSDFKTIDKDHALYIYETDTLYLSRLNEKVLTRFDFDCSMKINRKRFDEMLMYEFLSRFARSQNECLPGFLLELSEPQDEIYGNFDSTLFHTDLTQPFGGVHNVYHVIQQEIQSDSSYTKLISVNYNADSSEAIITLDHIDFCYDSYNETGYIDEENQMQLILENLWRACPDRCLSRYYFVVSIHNVLVNEIFLNGVRIE